MKQFRITSADFVSPGENGETDAYLSFEDLTQLRKETGIDQLGIMKRHSENQNEQKRTPESDQE